MLKQIISSQKSSCKGKGNKWIFGTFYVSKIDNIWSGGHVNYSSGWRDCILEYNPENYIWEEKGSTNM